MAKSRLKAKTPDEGLITKPKVLIFGPPGTGKTWTSLDFPAVYYIDTEGGASLPQYQRKLKAAGGVYFGREDGSGDFGSVIAEVQALATEKHPYLTLVIDSFSKLYLSAAAVAEVTVGNDFGKDKKEAQKPTRRLLSWIDRLDMNVVLVCHAKEKWVRSGKELVSEGQTYDGWDKMEYDLHLCLEVCRDGSAAVHKTRLDGFKRGDRFPWKFSEFERRAGSAVMLRPPAVVELATPEQVAHVKKLLQTVRVADDWEEKVLQKANAASWAEMDAAKAAACISHLTALATAAPGPDDAGQ
jgi:hypothetical protein